ncbi:LrgB family protein [Vibrio maerlii]|uniref:LrgB family protein n=1 Tax=Vibrio maerlii TaxID=2231648 RepID=UPI000E3C7259|nr:LrgB family protein [Vibrio maerlii]
MWILLTVTVFFVCRYVCQKLNTPLANPLLFSVAIIIPILLALDIDFDTYYADNTFISMLLQPAVVALALPLYEQLPQIRTNWRIIMLACVVGSGLSLFTASTFAVFFGADLTLVASVLGKSVTTPIAMEISSQMGGEAAIAAILVLIAGLVGALFAYPIYQFLGIQHPIAKGLTMGNVSHALGTATSAEKDPRDAAFSSLALVICGVITSILAPLAYDYALWLSIILR